MNKHVDLSALPRRKDGKIAWKQSVGHSVPFVYGDVSGSISLLEYMQDKRTFKVFIEGYTRYQYDTANIDTIKQCQLGRLLYKKIIDTNPEMIQYFVDKDDALKYSNQSNIRIDVYCPFCGHKKTQIIANLYKFGFSCPRCSDGVSYPNKLMFNILQQLGVKFKNEITKRDCGFEWVNEYRYDFYFEKNNQRYFIEMDGHFHKINRMDSIEKIIHADKIKDLLAYQHGIEVIRIDCCYPNEKNKLYFIKNNIVSSKLSEILSLDFIDWSAANKFAITSNIKIAAEHWNDGYTIKQIASKIGVSEDSITNYLKRAAGLSMCSYNKETSKARRIVSCKLAMGKPIIVYDNNNHMNVFEDAEDLSKKSCEIYQKQFKKKSIQVACNQHRLLYGYTMKYISREEYEQLLPQFQTIQN